MAWFERMRDGAHHRRGRTARKLRVGIERENVADLRKNVEAAGLDGKCVVLADQQLVQVEKLAALALPAHPHSLAHVEDAMAMKEEKAAVFGRCVAGVQIR